MASLEGHFPPEFGCHVWEPSSKFVEAVLTAILRKPQSPESPLVVPSSAQQRVAGPTVDKIKWPSMPATKLLNVHTVQALPEGPGGTTTSTGSHPGLIV